MDAREVCLKGVSSIGRLLITHGAWGSAPAQIASAKKSVAAPEQPRVELASTQETVEELKRRLGKELYRLELDLQGGLRIAGKPCDCADAKHSFGVEATAEELMSYEHNPAFGQIIDWYHRHLPEFKPVEIAKHEPEYYRAMVPDLRAFRKDIMGTEKISSLLNTEERARVMEKLQNGGAGTKQ